MILKVAPNMQNDDDIYHYAGEEEYTAGVPDSELLLRVKAYDWPGTLARVQSHPEECRSTGGLGRTPLHVACDQDAPYEVLEALLVTYPEAALSVGTSNMNPLHITCSSNHASIPIVKLLLQIANCSLAKQQASMRDVDGDTPLHAACRCGAPIEVLQMLLRVYPEAANLRCNEGLTPLMRLWVRYFVILGDNFVDKVIGRKCLTGKLGMAWQKTKLLLGYAYHGPSVLSSPQSFLPMHAAAAVDCPRPVVKLATIVYKEHLLFRDANGMTPLLLAAQAPIYNVPDLSDDGSVLEDRLEDSERYDQPGESGEDIPSEEYQNSKHESVISIIVKACPQAAAIADPEGRLPLHLAIATGKRSDQGIQALLEANPAAGDGIKVGPTA